MTTTLAARVSDDEAIAHGPCPRCHAPHHAPCVYLYPAGYRSDGKYQDLIQRAGQPNTTVHPERRNMVRRHRRTQNIPEHTPNRRLTPIQATQQWELREQRRLRAWLAAHGHLLWTVTA